MLVSCNKMWNRSVTACHKSCYKGPTRRDRERERESCAELRAMHDICCLLTQARINKEYSFCFIQDSPVGQGVGMQQHLTLITGLLLGDDGNKFVWPLTVTRVTPGPVTGHVLILTWTLEADTNRQVIKSPASVQLLGLAWTLSSGPGQRIIFCLPCT